MMPGRADLSSRWSVWNHPIKEDHHQSGWNIRLEGSFFLFFLFLIAVRCICDAGAMHMRCILRLDIFFLFFLNSRAMHLRCNIRCTCNAPCDASTVHYAMHLRCNLRCKCDATANAQNTQKLDSSDTTDETTGEAGGFKTTKNSRESITILCHRNPPPPIKVGVHLIVCSGGWLIRST